MTTEKTLFPSTVAFPYLRTDVLYVCTYARTVSVRLYSTYVGYLFAS